MSDFAAQWGSSKDVFKDVTKKDKPENAKTILGIITLNGSNINSALKKVDAEFKKHDDFLKVAEKASWNNLNKVGEARTKIIASTKAAITAYETIAQAYTPKLTVVIDKYKDDKKESKAKEQADRDSGAYKLNGSTAALKTDYVRSIKLLDKQLKSISSEITAELDAFEKKSKAALARGDSKDAADAAVATTLLPLARAAIKKVAVALAQAKAVVGKEAPTQKERVDARFKAFQTLQGKPFDEAYKAMIVAREKGLKVPDDIETIFNSGTRRWMNLLNDKALLDIEISKFSAELKGLDGDLTRLNK